MAQKQDVLVRLEKGSEDEWDGRADGNADVRAVFASGRELIFTVFTLQNLADIMAEDPECAHSFVTPFMLIVARLDEACIRDAVNKWLQIEYAYRHFYGGAQG